MSKKGTGGIAEPTTSGIEASVDRKPKESGEFKRASKRVKKKSRDCGIAGRLIKKESLY